MTVRLSPTSLTRWFEAGCPAAWKYSQDLEVLTPNIHLLVGNAVHGMMEGVYTPADTVFDPKLIGMTPEMWRQASTIYGKLLSFKAELGLTVLLGPDNLPLVEFKYEWGILPGIQLVCKVDFIGTDANGDVIIADWKSTLGNGWKHLILDVSVDRVPQMFGFQSMAYLIPPPAKMRRRLGLPIEGWPEKLYYLIGPARGPCQVFIYRRNEEDYANFKSALVLAANSIQAHNYPKVKGKHCVECDFRFTCYGAPQADTLYATRSSSADKAAAAKSGKPD